MALILSIDVAGPNGLVLLGESGNYVDSVYNNQPMQHAAFLQPAIYELFQLNNKQLSQVAAISLSNGPGSYTGLRVGLASAKGLCYALGIPLITINSLQLLAFATKQKLELDLSSIKGTESLVQYFSIPSLQKKLPNFTKCLICPMLDARRMEVFFGLYDTGNAVLIPATSAILEDSFLTSWLDNYSIIFVGSGSEKWQRICTHPNAFFLPEPPIDLAFLHLSYQHFLAKDFADLAFSEPFYSKSFYNAANPAAND
jgi:tRNA threonylcarbamoyladenosine biosynthesis protein TsaB